MLRRAFHLAESMTVFGLLAGSALLMHAAALRGERGRRVPAAPRPMIE